MCEENPHIKRYALNVGHHIPRGLWNEENVMDVGSNRGDGRSGVGAGSEKR